MAIFQRLACAVLACAVLLVVIGASARAETEAEAIATLAHGPDAKTVAGFEGVAPPRVPGLVQSKAFSGLCVWDCLVFLGPNNGRDEAFPAIIVHRPFAVDAETMLAAYIAAENGPNGDGVVEQQPVKILEGHPRYRSLMQIIRKDDDRDLVFLTVLEKDGVSVVVELFVARDRNLKLRTKAYAAFVSQFRFDPALIARNEDRRASAVSRATEAVGKAFEDGGTVEVYTRVVMRWGLTGMTFDGISQFGQRAERDVMILLPGGVVLEELPDAPLASLQLGSAIGVAEPTIWREQSGGVTIIRADGTREQMRRSAGGRRLSDPDGEGDWTLAPPLTSRSLVGAYSYFRLVTWDSAGDAGGVATSGADLQLGSDGRYTLTTSRSGSSSDSQVALLSRRSAREDGRWSFDPASYTLWLTPAGGRRYGVPALKLDDTACSDRGCIWLISNETWRRKN